MVRTALSFLPTAVQAVLQKTEKDTGELEGKLAHEKEKFKGYDKDVKAAQKKHEGVDKEYQVCVLGGGA